MGETSWLSSSSNPQKTGAVLQLRLRAEVKTLLSQKAGARVIAVGVDDDDGFRRDGGRTRAAPAVFVNPSQRAGRFNNRLERVKTSEAPLSWVGRRLGGNA
jgi:hypothetical protein